MSACRTTSEPSGAASIVHPAFVRDRLAPLFARRSGMVTGAGAEAVQYDSGAFERMRARAGAITPSIGAPHPGAKGRVAFQLKRVVARAIYWYVDPLVGRLRDSILESVDVSESMARDVTADRSEIVALRREVEALRRDLDRQDAARLPSSSGIA